MARAKPIRCDEWSLLADADTVRMARDSIEAYRRIVRALATVFLTHWHEVHNQPVQGLERLVHITAGNPQPKYGAWFSRHFPKFPAYLRRAAAMAAHGAVSSFMTRQRSWQSGQRRMRANRPPRFGTLMHWPVLYAAKGGAGAMIRHDGNATWLKLFDSQSGDWLWRRAAILRRGRRHGGEDNVPKSPTLILRGSALSLGQPYEMPRRKPGADSLKNDLVCSADLGMNKGAVLTILGRNGTVHARKFVSRASHIDRRDKVLVQIRDKARQTVGSGGQLSKGFCRGLYARARGLNLQIARDLARAIIAFAKGHDCHTLVLERLKGFRPKGGAKGSPLRAKFHGWLHRALAKQAEATAEEVGLRVSFVLPRGTSTWAYDGSGKVRRHRGNHGRCTFRSGKEYDADLSAAQNIAARWFARRERRKALDAERRDDAQQNSPDGGKTVWPARGKRSGEATAKPSTTGPRMPVTLSSLWQTPQQAAA